MPSRKDSLVALCQQSLALGAVLAVLTPAASVVSIDIVSEAPHRSASPATATLSMESARVPVAPVDPTVHEIALTPARGATFAGRSRAGAGLASLRRTTTGEQLVSHPEAVSGYGTVGVTWAHGETSAQRQMAFQVRTQSNGVWSAWQPLGYDDEHSPDAGTPEAAHARPGTDALIVGAVDNVQIRATTTGAVPDDMKLAVIDPGSPVRTAVEAPAIDTSKLASAQDQAVAGWGSGDLSGGSSASGSAPRSTASAATADRVALQATVVTPKPVIFSRAQWGADERLREPSSLHYGEVHAGFIHHTVNANGYSADEVPSILRGIYAYHTQSRGWSDIGYNYLIDRFGRIWEGRYGGVDRDVVGAHTLGYNDWSFGASAIGNYQTTQPSAAMLEAYARLYAWKLSLAGVNVLSTRQWVGTRYFQAINGHRDADQTLCPGQYLYAKIPWIRQRAAQLQATWAGRQLPGNLTGSPAPDLVVRRASDGRAFVLPMGSGLGFGAPATSTAGLAGRQVLVLSPDLTGDGKPDLLVGPTSGLVAIRPGLGNGQFGAPAYKTRLFAGRDLITAAGDLNGDGRNDLLARDPATGRLNVYLGNGAGGFTRSVHRSGWNSYDTLVGIGDVNGDQHSDLVARGTDGSLALLLGSGRGGVMKKIALPGSWSGDDVITAGDFDGDGRTDLLVRGATDQLGWIYRGLGGGTFDTKPIGPIRGLAGLKALQGGALVGTPASDLVGTDSQNLVVLTNQGSGTGFGAAINTGRNFTGARQVFNVGDWDRDGYGDVLVLFGPNLFLYRGNGTGQLAPPVLISRGFAGVSLLAAVGDMTGDGYPDLMGKNSAGTMMIFPGNGTAGLKAAYPAYSSITASQQIGAGLWDGDGAPDSLFRVGNQLKLYRGNGPGGLMSNTTTYAPSVAAYDWIISIPDVTGDVHTDLLARNRTTGRLDLLTGSLASGFTTVKPVGTGMLAYDLAD